MINKYNKKFMVCHSLRFSPRYSQAKLAVENQEIVEDSVFTTNLTGSDIDGDQLTYTAEADTESNISISGLSNVKISTVVIFTLTKFPPDTS